MKYYLTTDTHFGHNMLIERGYRPADFEKRIMVELARINSSNNIVIHLGDICIGNDKENNIRLLNVAIPACKKILVRGNHDKKSDSFYYDCGWDFVCDQFTLKKYGKKILFSHEPTEGHTSDINIHGHWHDNDHRIEPEFKDWYYDDWFKLLTLEHTNYKPVELHKFIST